MQKNKLHFQTIMGRYREDFYERINYDKAELPILRRNNHIADNYDLSCEMIHFHPDVEFIYVYSGTAGYVVNGKKITIKEGGGLFVNSGQFHCLEKINNTGFELYCVVFSPHLLAASNYIADKYVEPVINSPSPDYILLSDEEPIHKKLLEEIKTICEIEESDDSDLAVIGHLYILWQYVYRNIYKSGNQGTSKKRLTIIQSMVSFIEEHYGEPVTLDDICKSGGVGKTCCIQMFKKYMFCSPIEYLTEVRLSRAAYLLRNSNNNITEIAYGCGFNGASYFAERFRQKYGVTPSEYKICGCIDKEN